MDARCAVKLLWTEQKHKDKSAIFSAGFAKDNVKSMLCVPIVQVIFLMCPNNIVDLMLPHQSTQICIKLDLHCMTGPQLGRYVS